MAIVNRKAFWIQSTHILPPPPVQIMVKTFIMKGGARQSRAHKAEKDTCKGAGGGCSQWVTCHKAVGPGATTLKGNICKKLNSWEPVFKNNNNNNSSG